MSLSMNFHGVVFNVKSQCLRVNPMAVRGLKLSTEIRPTEQPLAAHLVNRPKFKNKSLLKELREKI